MHDPLQALGEPHGTQEVEGPQAVAGVGEVQQRPRLDQEADGWARMHALIRKTWQPTRGKSLFTDSHTTANRSLKQFCTIKLLMSNLELLHHIFVH